MKKEQARQFLSKLESSADGINFYFSSDLSNKAITEISLAYDLDRDDVDSLVFDLVINDFNFTSLENRIKLLVNDEQIAKNIFIDFLGKICLPLDEYIETDVNSLINSNNVKSSNYESYVVNFKQAFDDYISELVDDYLNKVESTINLEEEVEATIDLISNHLLSVLRSNNVESLLDFNRGTAYVLNNKPELSKTLENILLDSDIVLTENPLVIKDQQADATVGNWINDFIATMGIEKFDSLVIADYMIKSVNIKNLNDKERDLVQKLITLYLNIKFYPNSMDGKPINEWYILPLPMKETLINSNHGSLSKRSSQSNISEIKQDYKKEKLVKLQKLLSNYSENSLERLAIEEEIKKLNKM